MQNKHEFYVIWQLAQLFNLDHHQSNIIYTLGLQKAQLFY